MKKSKIFLVMASGLFSVPNVHAQPVTLGGSPISVGTSSAQSSHDSQGQYGTQSSANPAQSSHDHLARHQVDPTVTPQVHRRRVIRFRPANANAAK